MVEILVLGPKGTPVVEILVVEIPVLGSKGTPVVESKGTPVVESCKLDSSIIRIVVECCSFLWCIA